MTEWQQGTPDFDGYYWVKASLFGTWLVRVVGDNVISYYAAHVPETYDVDSYFLGLEYAGPLVPDYVTREDALVADVREAREWARKFYHGQNTWRAVCATYQQLAIEATDTIRELSATAVMLSQELEHVNAQHDMELQDARNASDMAIRDAESRAEGATGRVSFLERRVLELDAARNMAEHAQHLLVLDVERLEQELNVARNTLRDRASWHAQVGKERDEAREYAARLYDKLVQHGLE